MPLEVRLGSQVDIVTQMTKWTRNINLTLNIGLRVSGLSFGFSGSPCFFIVHVGKYTYQSHESVMGNGYSKSPK